MNNILFLSLFFLSCKGTPIPETVFVQGGTFTMGNEETLSRGWVMGDIQKHAVTLGDYEIGKYEVTAAEYRAFCVATGREFPRTDSISERHPVNRVSWHEAVEYCKWLSGVTGSTWRLPTEAEWEYAARGGAKSQNFKYSGSNDLDEVTRYNSKGYILILNDDGSTTIAVGRDPADVPVGRMKPNELGIYDMSGNVAEWCSDWYAWDYYAHSPAHNPQGPDEGTAKVIRGGNWMDALPSFDQTNNCLVYHRRSVNPEYGYGSIGFRVVRESPPNPPKGGKAPSPKIQ